MSIEERENIKMSHTLGWQSYHYLPDVFLISPKYTTAVPHDAIFIQAQVYLVSAGYHV